MRAAILVFCGMLLLGSAGAFLLYVSIVSILTANVILATGMIMFVLGMQVEKQRHPLPEIPSKEKVPEMQETRVPLDIHVRA